MGKTFLRRRGRLLLVVAIAVAALALSASLVIANAIALPTFTGGSGSVPSCVSCHSMADTHANSNHSSLPCADCHVSGTATAPTPAACAACHGAATIMQSTTHAAPATGCDTTPGCHGAVSPSPTPTVTPAPTVVAAKVTIKSARSVRVRKALKISGLVQPTSLAGAKVKLTIQKKVHHRWKTVKTARATVRATGAYAYKYKPTKKGTYHVRGAVAKSVVTKAAHSSWRTFRVK